LVVINNKYQDLEHSLDKRSRIEAMKDPDLNGADEVYDKDLCEFVRLPTEQHKRIKLGFYHANILSQLRPKASHLYIIILCNTDKWQKTYILNEKLSILSGLSVREISKGYDNKKNSLLNELEYWHLIERRKLPNPKYPKKQNRCITVHRWDKALELLKKDGKVIVDENGKITTRPNPFKE
jgi:hypothetical protein